eukprot:gene1375-4550_t
MSTSDVSESNPTSNATSQRSSPETPSARSLQVNVSKVLNVQTTREEGAWVTFTVDFCGTTSPPSEVLTPCDEKSLNFVFSFNVTTNLPEDVERAVNSSITITATEHMKEKKKKGEVAIPLGSISIDPLPLFLGKSTIQNMYQLSHPSHLNFPKPIEFDVAITIPHPLLTRQQAQDLNILTCTVSGISRLPHSLISSGQDASYTLRLGEAGTTFDMEFSDGIVHISEEAPSSYDVDGGDTTTKLVADNSQVFFRGGNYKRFCLPPNRQQELIDFISRHRSCDALLSRVIITPTKSRSRVEDDTPSHRSVAHVQMTRLLYPGVVHVALGYYLRTFKADNTDVNATDGSGSAEDNRKLRNKPKTPSISEHHSEPHAFEDAGTFIVLEFELTRPLVEKRTIEVIAQRVASLVPPRDTQPSPFITAQEAVNAFKQRVSSIANELIRQYRATQQQLGSVSSNEVKQQILKYLNETGKYDSFKEELKQTVIRIVREKFANSINLENSQAREELISKLYVYLTREMHETLNSQFAFHQQSHAQPTAIPKKNLCQFAAECEALKQLDKAQTIWNECVQRFPQDVMCWTDYASFACRVGDLSKAEECARQAISIDQQHSPALTLLGLTSIIHGLHQEGLDLLEAATSYSQNSATIWAIRYVATKHVDPDNVTAQLYLDTAMKHHTPSSKHYSPPLLHAADYLLGIGMSIFAQASLAEHIVLEGRSIDSRLIEARLVLESDKPDPEEAKSILDACLSQNFQDPEIWIQLGHACFSTNIGLSKLVNIDGLPKEQARSHYEHALQLPGDSSGEHTVRLRLGEIYLSENDFAEAKDIYLRTCTQSASSTAWLGLGIACYRLGELSDAEEALAEANVYDPHNPVTWAYLCLICLRTARGVEAEQCYKFATKEGLADSVGTYLCFCHPKMQSLCKLLMSHLGICTGHKNTNTQLEMKELGIEPALVA